MGHGKAISKKSFILYVDQKEIFEKLSGDECKELILAIFDIVNGKVVNSANRIIDLVLTPIKSQLSRDQDRWEEIRNERSIAGSKGGKARIAKLKQNQANQAVTVNENVNVINKKDNTPRLDFKKLELKSSQIKNHA